MPNDCEVAGSPMTADKVALLYFFTIILNASPAVTQIYVLRGNTNLH